MARKAIRTGYGTQMIGGVEVKRLIVAGQNVPPTITAPPGTFEDDAAANAEAAAKLTEATAPQSATPTQVIGEPATTTAGASSPEPEAVQAQTTANAAADAAGADGQADAGQASGDGDAGASSDQQPAGDGTPDEPKTGRSRRR